MVSDRLLRYAHAFCGPDIRLGYLGLLTNPCGSTSTSTGTGT